MRAGATVGGRYRISSRAGAGAMGTVWRALDGRTERTVAVKVLSRFEPDDQARFAREIELLRTVDHPAVLRYVDHGQLDEGLPFLVTEWLEGQSLDGRLAEGALSLWETATLGARLAGALAEAHRSGVVHRDIKPSNVFLVGDDVAEAKLLDFGVARRAGTDPAITLPGLAAGTPAYMAPEQARGETRIDPRSDFFSLGCVLWECAMGRRAFTGRSAMGVLVKVLLEEVPRLSGALQAPAELDALLAECLSKDPDGRPADAETIAARLERTRRRVDPGAPPARLPAPPRPAGRALGEGEQRVVALVLAREPRPSDETATLGADELDARGAELAALARRHRVRVEALGRGALAAVVERGPSAVDLARRAARFACALAERSPHVPVAVAMGRSVVGRGMPAGDAADEAVRVLDRAGPDAVGRVAVDEVAAGLLAGTFDLARTETGRFVRAERSRERPLELLGRRSAFVGRRRELETLEALVARVANERRARVALVRGESGIGKTRLARELVARLERRPAPPRVIVARAEPEEATFGLAAAVVRDVADLRAGEPGGVTRAKLRARVARGLPDGEAARVTSFLAEVVGVRDERARSVQLDAAREDPRLMGEQIRRAFEDFVENELRAAPLAIVLDDLQWGDPPTLALFARLLRNLAHRPLAVIGLTRPAPARSLGAPWDGATLLELEALAPDDAARLATRALAAAGRACDPDEVTRIVDRGRGNPLCLEELVRGAIQGALDETPTTVMAMAQARIVELPAELRRVLRAASVFGDELWVPGVERLLGEAAGGVRVGDALARLSARGLLEPRPASRYPDHAAWSFRHETIRASAYEMLTERDRRLGHELAAEWLEEVGEHDPIRMIAHHERAGRPVRAIPWYRAAAEIALEAEALEAALDLSERGVRAGARGPVLGALRLVQAQAWSWSAKADEARRAARSAMSALLAGSEAWYRALEVLAFASLHPDVEDTLADTERELAAGAAAPTRGWTRACARLAVANFQAGHGERAARLLAMVEAAPAELAEAPDVAAAIARARASRAARDGDDAACLVHLRRAAAHHRESGSERRASIERLNSAALEIALGLYEEAEAQLGEALWEAERVGLAIVRDAARLNLGHALARTGRVDEALAQLARAAPSLREQGDPRLMGAAALYEGRAHLAGGALEEAERCTRQACELLAAVPPVRPVAEAQLARILAARGATEEALALATGAARALEAGHEIESDHGLVRLALAEALEAAGRREEAARAYAAAARAVRERAATIVDPGWRRAFLERVEEHALALRAAAGVS